MITLIIPDWLGVLLFIALIVHAISTMLDAYVSYLELKIGEKK